MSIQCETIDRPAQATLSIRSRANVAELPELMGQVFGAIKQYLREAGQFPIGAPYAAYFNMDMQDLDVESGFPVAAALPGKGDVQPGEIPAGRAASCVHVGPYDQFEQTYAALTAFVAGQGLEATGASYEFYTNNPTEVPPEELRTQILFPLKEAWHPEPPARAGGRVAL